MNIIVNFPVKSLFHFGKYSRSKVVFWPVSKKPSKLNVGDKVFVAADGVVLHYYLFCGFAKDPMCEETGRIIPGLVLLLQVSPETFHKDIKVKKFNGFIYTNEDYDGI